MRKSQGPNPKRQIPIVCVLGFGIWVLGFSAQARGQARDWPSEPQPRPLAAHAIEFPPYEIRPLANGMRVVAVLHHEQPAVSIRLLVGRGLGAGSKGKGRRREPDGVAARPGDDHAQRAADRGSDRLHRRRPGNGRGHRPVVRECIVMKDSFQTGMDLVADVARNPAFAPEEIARQKDQILSSLRVNADDTGYIADVVFDRLVYGFHPYGLPGSGTEESLGALTREDLQAFHRQYFVPNNMILAIVGDVTSDEAFAAAQRGVRRLATRRRFRRRRRLIRRAGAADRHHRQAGRRADEHPRRAARDCAKASRITWRGTSP